MTWVIFDLVLISKILTLVVPSLITTRLFSNANTPTAVNTLPHVGLSSMIALSVPT